MRQRDLLPPSPPPSLPLDRRGRHRRLLVGVMEQLELVPVHRDDPLSSYEAAERAASKVGGQLAQVLQVLGAYAYSGRSNREIQIAVCGGYNPGHPAWNKIPTRCRTLERRGLIELVTDADGEPVLRDHPSGGRFLVWRVRRPGGEVAEVGTDRVSE